MTPIEFIRGFVLPHECAYAPGHYGDLNFVVTEHVAGDNGGATKWGIDQRSHPSVDIDSLTQDQAEAIYLDEYNAISWTNLDTQALNVFAYPAGLAFFDIHILNGTASAWKCVQRALDLVDDGVPGPKTRTAVLKAPGFTLASSMIDERRLIFKSIVNHNPSQSKFLEGWLNRCDDLKRFLLQPS